MLNYGEVIDTSMAYSEKLDSYGLPYPKGAILVRLAQSSELSSQNVIAIPLTPSDYEIPLIGEHVTLTSGMSIDTNTDFTRERYFYGKIINSTSNAAENIVQGFFDIKATNSSILANGIRKSNVSNQRKNTRSLAFLQPYEGDRILQSRYGSSIRFSSNILDTSNYTQKPSWYGTVVNSPILILSNGINTVTKDTNKFAIENINDDASSIYLTTSQLINLNLSQSRISLGLLPVSTFNKPQSIINADRIILNAKNDAVVLSGKKTVSISTPNWAADMDKMFTQIDNMQRQLTQLTSQLTALTTLITTAATSDIPAATALSAIGIPLLGPNILVGGTPAVISQLSTISTELGKITATLATLKQ